jgi:hypothetical protein
MGSQDVVEGRLVDSLWVLIPFFVAHPQTLSVEFFDDGSGRTIYELLGVGRTIPDLTEADWAWHLDPQSPDHLYIRWSDNTELQGVFRIEDVAFTVNNADREPTTFTAKLTPPAHLFPLGAGFPDGWHCEYFGYPIEGSK